METSLDAFSKLKLSLEKPYWGAHHPTEYTQRHVENDNIVGIGMHYLKQQRDAIFNLWLWQMDFIKPEQYRNSPPYDETIQWLLAEKFSVLEHKGFEIGVAALCYTPNEFKKYIRGFSLALPFMYKTYRLRKLISNSH